MRNPVNPLLAIGGLFVVGFLIFLLVGDESEKVYTRISVVVYEQERSAACKGDMQQAAQSLKRVVEYQSPKVPADGQLGRALKLVRQGAIREIIARMRTLSGEDLGMNLSRRSRVLDSDKSRPDHPAAGNAGFGVLFAFGDHFPGVPDPGR